MAQYINSEVITMWLLKQFIIPSPRVLNTYIISYQIHALLLITHHFINTTNIRIDIFLYFDRKLHQLNPMLVKYLNTMEHGLCDNIIWLVEMPIDVVGVYQIKHSFTISIDWKWFILFTFWPFCGIFKTFLLSH